MLKSQGMTVAIHYDKHVSLIDPSPVRNMGKIYYRDIFPGLNLSTQNLA